MNSTNYLCFLLITLFLIHQSTAQITDDASVIFLDSPTHQYLRQNVKFDSMSVKEVGSAVSVLLGLAPADVSTESSAKLNELLMPNPFDRPRHVFMLEVGLAQDSQAMVYSHSAAFSSAIKSKVIDRVGNAEIELPDKEQVGFFSLDGPDVDATVAVSDKEMSDFASSFGGSYVSNDLESLSGELIIPLPSGSKLSLDMSKKAGRKFAISLMSLIDNVRRVTEINQDSSAAKLMGGYFDGIKVLGEEYGSEDIAQQGMELLLATVSRVFGAFQARCKGEAVAVILFNKAHSSQPQRMLDVTFASRLSLRRLAEAKASSNSTAIAEVALVRLTLAWTTGIVLLIAVYVGIYLLYKMPITKDTLLYSNVKLD